MKVRIQGKHLQLTDDVRSYVEDRVVRPLTRFYDDSAAELRVELGDTNGPKGGADKECHLTLHMPNARTLQIEETTQDVYASIDATSERLIRACKRELEKMRQPASHPKYRPLATTVAEGGVPGGLIEDLPDAPEIAQAAEDAKPR